MTLRANRIIVLSKSELNTLIDTYRIIPQKIELIPNGVGRHFFTSLEQEKSEENSIEMAFIGRLCKQKGIDVLFDALEILNTNGVKSKVSIIGGSYEEDSFEKYIRNRASSAPLSNLVSFVGQIQNQEIPSFLQKKPIYVQPSRYESQGIALLEAMAFGRVIIASDLPAIREYVISGYNGLLVEPCNPVLLANSLLMLHRDLNLQKKMASLAQQTAQKYQWNATVEKTLEVLLG